MATATGTPAKPTSGDNRVYNPLDQLRGLIRTYVLLEGVLSALLFVVAWFTLALVFDYGVFRAFTWDWAQDTGRWIRIVTLLGALGVLGFILVFRIIRRYTKDFSYPALALVLERKFPKQLGDRLITAIELANVESSAKYGYSGAMIRKTIEEARERVAKLPVSQAFNWRRLRVMAMLAVGSVLGLLSFGFASHAVAAGEVQPARAAWKCYHVSMILAERDVLMLNTPWPRRALVELLDVSERGIRVARGGKPRVRVKVYRWVIADRSKPDGWRPLMWSDVTESFVGIPVPQFPTNSSDPNQKVSLPGTFEEWTADSVLEDESIRGQLNNAMGLDGYESLQKVFEKLEEMADSPSYGRTLRKLGKPEKVSLEYTGLKRRVPGGELQSQGNSEYAGDITGLTEDVLFSVSAEDYKTPQRPITLIAPPALISLVKAEFQPAYLHYASPSGAGYAALSGLRQTMKPESLSLSGNRTLTVVPVGSELIITGKTDKPITRAFATPKVGRFPGAKPGSAAPVPLLVETIEEPKPDKPGESDAHGTFVIAFKAEDRPKSAVEFEVEFFNEDNVGNKREFSIQVTEDQGPVVELATQVIRRVGKEYWVTPRAKIPFNPESNLHDDRGLSKVMYKASYKPSDAAAVQSARASVFVRALPGPAAGGDLRSLVLSSADYFNQVRGDDTNSEKSPTYVLGQFDDLNKKLTRDTLERIKRDLLPEPKVTTTKPTLVDRIQLGTELIPRVEKNPNGTLKSFKWGVQGDFFDVKELNLEVAQGDPQPQYDLYLTIEATDTNFDTGPTLGRNEPIAFRIVSSSDLLVKIGDDEEKLATKLDDAIKKLGSARGKYDFVRGKSSLTNHDLADLEAVRVRSKDALQDVQKAREAVQSVGRDFRRIEYECAYNQLEDKVLFENGKRANRLDRVQGVETQPVTPLEEALVRDGTLRPKATFPETEKFMGDAQNAFDVNRWPDPSLVVNADTALALLEREIVSIRVEIGEAQTRDRLKNLLKSVKERQEAIGLAIVKWQREAAGRLVATTPELGAVPQLFLAKGETKKIKQAVSWRQFRGKELDVLNISVTSSDPSIVVPAMLKLDFEKNNFDFEYDVKAGTTAGEFTVTLTPEAGDKVELKIVVK